MRRHHVYVLAVAAVAVAAASARRSAPAGGTVPPDAVAYHGAWQLYRALALYFGKKALLAEAHYWEVVGHG